MKKLNRKGFTLVELLAVIVILALIMAIAVVSMSGILSGARKSTFKETAIQIINGVQQQLTLSNELVPSLFDSTGRSYVFTSKIIEKGGKTSPMGGDIVYATGIGANNDNNTKAEYPKMMTIGSNTAQLKQIGAMEVYRTRIALGGSCTASSVSYVQVDYDTSTGNFKYSICLTAGQGYSYIKNGELEKLLDNNDFSMIYGGPEGNI